MGACFRRNVKVDFVVEMKFVFWNFLHKNHRSVTGKILVSLRLEFLLKYSTGFVWFFGNSLCVSFPVFPWTMKNANLQLDFASRWSATRRQKLWICNFVLLFDFVFNFFALFLKIYAYNFKHNKFILVWGFSNNYSQYEPQLCACIQMRGRQRVRAATVFPVSVTVSLCVGSWVRVYVRGREGARSSLI